MTLKNIAQYGITSALLIFIALHINIGEFLTQITNIHADLFCIATLLIALQIYFLSLRWHDYINLKQEISPLSSSVAMTIAGHFANIVFISSAGGIIAKSALAIQKGLSPAQAIIITFLDRFMTLCALLILGIAGLPLLSHILQSDVALMLATGLSLLIAVIAATLAFLRSPLAKSLILSTRKKSKFFVYLRAYMEDYGLMKKTAIYSLLAQICFILSVYTLSLGIDRTGVTISALEFMAIIPVLALLASLPISLGGWGVREGAFIYGLGLMGFMPESALLLSIQVGIVTLIVPAIIAVPYLITGNWKTCFKKQMNNSKP